MSGEKVFATIQVSEDLHRMVRAVEQAAVTVTHQKDREDVMASYHVLAMSRKFLYEYLEVIERLAEVEAPMTTLRFD